MGKILAICISEKRGTAKFEIPQAEVKVDWGIVGDAHGGNWHRQISLLSFEKIEAFRSKGANVDFGAFGENLVSVKEPLRTGNLDEVRRRLEKAIYQKPYAHCFEELDKITEEKKMNQIGG